MVEVCDDPQQFPAAIRDLCPASGEEVGVQLALDRIDRNHSRLVICMLLNEDVEDLTADELNEVWIAARLMADRLDRIRMEVNGAVRGLNRLEDRLSALIVAELGLRRVAEHALRVGACVHQLGKEGRQASQDQHERDPLLLDGLEDIKEHRQWKL